MLVNRSQLIPYDISSDLFFARRTGEGEPISRDQFFINNPSRLKSGMFDAIGSDTTGWELEQYNGINWKTVEPDSSYMLIITSQGLAALTNVQRGGLQLFFSGVKIINHIVTNPATPIINWTDNDLLQAGEVVFSVGTKGSPHEVDKETGNSLLNQVLSWRFNTSAGGLQYILTLPPEGFGSMSDDNKEEWNIGAIGLYVKDPTNNSSDVLFGVATLPKVVTKYASGVKRVGNAIKLYFNTILSNLGVVSNLQVMTSDDHSIPEVQNESLLTYPSDPKQRPYNCYLVDSLYGTGIPALAIPRSPATDYTDVDWAYIQPTDNFITLDSSAFGNVPNYTFVYWDGDTKKYELAEGRKVSEPAGTNNKMPMGIRIGNSIVFSGEIHNDSTSYSYNVSILSAGSDYAVNDELLLAGPDGLTFKIQVIAVNEVYGITGFKLIGPSVGNTPIENGSTILTATYDPRSQLPRYGAGARFVVQATEQTSYAWDFPGSWLNKPLYCDNGDKAGYPTLTKTDSFLGWCTGTNSIRLALDLRNEASTAVYGTTRYATDYEVKEILTNANASEQTAITPKTLNNNYLQTTLPTNQNQAGSKLGNPINVQSYVRFDKIVLGSGTKTPYDNTTTNPNVTEAGISFYGNAFRSFWGDVAEFYEADKFYEPGTLIVFGQGEKEISIAVEECDGIISSKPGYQLGERRHDLDLPVALVGRVPVKMDGNCLPKFGDKIYLSKIKKGCASTVENGKCLGKIIAKHPSPTGLVECSVRIDF